jgi:type III restriction enzyme
MPSKIDQLIINSPYEPPARHWRYERETKAFQLLEGRRPAGYVIATPDSQAHDDPGIFVELPTVNAIRERVDAWRANGRPGVSAITRRLLEHWHDSEERENRRLFFCQLEAIETLIWWVEASPAEKQGIVFPGDGGPFERLCNKMATGSGKTIVMAMLAAWQILNKVSNPQDTRYSKHILIVAPGLTVKERLQVLHTGGEGNYYDEFNIVPGGLRERLRQGTVKVVNWHKLQWETDDKISKRRSVDKRGALSDEAYVRQVLGEMQNARNIVVINDEAHHAWRVPPGAKVEASKAERDEATVWMAGLDRIHKARNVLRCFDLSATPFMPTGKRSSDETLFNWIVSDFGLNDAIESGLVKTPRVVIRDDANPDAKTYKSRLYHIYNDHEVKDDLNRKAEPTEPLPDLVVNGYMLLGADWVKTADDWKSQGHTLPPVMISVVNRTETAARVANAFRTGAIDIPALGDDSRLLHIDSKVLEKAEQKEEAASVDASDSADTDDDSSDDAPVEKKLTKQQFEELLRQQVSTIGKEGQPGERFHNIISVGMLSEGWDARTVTHIMGLRAFSSQLLCEQVVGRGLRRVSYDVNPETGLFEPEHVNIFGVPFSFLPHEGGEDTPPPPPKPTTRIEVVPERAEFAVSWPNVIRVDHVLRHELAVDWTKVPVLSLQADEVAIRAELAPVIEGKPNTDLLSDVNLEEYGRRKRLQTIVFRAAAQLCADLAPGWRGTKEMLIAQLVRIVGQFMDSGKIRVEPVLWGTDDVRRRIIYALNMGKLFQHLKGRVIEQDSERVVPILDSDHPIRSTADMRPWYTTRPCERSRRSHISHCVYDSTWEATEAFELERNPNVAAWVKNDHLGFEVLYVYRGVVRKYRPDYLIRLTNGVILVLEVKGQDDEHQRVKRDALAQWVKAVNEHGEFGRWGSAVSYNPKDIEGLIRTQLMP